MTKSLTELGALMKREYPQYQEMSDAEVGIRVYEKYPAKYPEYLSQQLATILNHYSPSKGVFRSWWQQRRSEARYEMSQALSREAYSVIERAAALEEAAVASARRRVEFKAFLITHQHQIEELRLNEHLLTQAVGEGMTVDDFSEANLGTRKSQDKINEIKAEVAAKELVAKLESERRVNEFRQMEIIKHDLEIAKAREEVRLSTLSKTMTSNQKILLIQEQIDELYRQIERIRDEDIPWEIKKLMMGDRQDIINQFKEQRDAEGNRLVADGEW